MTHTPTPAPISNIRSLLDTLANTYDAASSVRAVGSYNTAQRVRRVSGRLEALGKLAEDGELTPDQEAEKEALYDGLQKINIELGRLDPKEQIGVLSPSPTSTAEQDQRAAVLRENLKKQAEAADAEQAAAVRQQEFEEQDLTDIQVIRSAYQHYLLYNTDFFAEYHKQLLNVGSTSLVGYKIPSITG